MTRTRILISALALVGAGMIGGLTAPLLAGASPQDPSSSQSVGELYTSAGITGRVLDTRTTFKRQGGDTVEVYIGSGPSHVVVNIKATEAEANGYVSTYPRGTAQPNTSVLDYQAGDTVSNLAIVPVSPDGVIVLYTSEATHLVVDVQGRFGSTQVNFPEPPPVESIPD